MKTYHSPTSSSKEHDGTTKTPPLFTGDPNIDKELRPFNTARWEEPLMGPDGQSPGKYAPGGLINQKSLMRPFGSSTGHSRDTTDYEPTQKDAPLHDADFPHKGVGFTKGTDHNLDYGAK